MSWIQDKKEVEVVDLVLRLREKLVSVLREFSLSQSLLEFINIIVCLLCLMMADAGNGSVLICISLIVISSCQHTST